jgi:uncharacterized damage-inducible protein DinB
MLGALGSLTPEQLAVSLPTGQGPPLVTMKHIAGAELYYLSLMQGERLDWGWEEERDYSIDEVATIFDRLNDGWAGLLTQDLDPGRMLDTRQSRLKAGVLLAQTLHHANVHREQVSAVLTSLGLEPPDVSGWAYGRASGGIVPK